MACSTRFTWLLFLFTAATPARAFYGSRYFALRAQPDCCSAKTARSAVRALVDDKDALGGRPQARLELVDRVFAMLGGEREGHIDRSALFGYTRRQSAAFGRYARATFVALDTDNDDRVTHAELLNMSDLDLVVFLTPGVFEAFHTIDLSKRGYLNANDVAALLDAKQLEPATREAVAPLLAELVDSSDGHVTLLTLARLSDVQLGLLERAGTEARRTGYVPPELSKTEIDDSWDRRVIAESRAMSGGMNCRQADLLTQAIKWNR
jgi:Ca2+-binding EF-hand superfamily protein